MDGHGGAGSIRFCLLVVGFVDECGDEHRTLWRFIGILAVISVIMKLVFTYYIYRSGQAYEAALQGKKSGSSQKSQG